MAYFKIGDDDYSMYVNSLKVKSKALYNSQTNAAGDSVVDYINTKREIEVGIIPVNDIVLLKLQLAIKQFNVEISFLNPATNALEENVVCIIPDDEVDYYTIQTGKTLTKAMTLTFTEL